MEIRQFRHKNDQMKKIPCNHYLNEAVVSHHAKKLLKNQQRRTSVGDQAVEAKAKVDGI